MCALVGTVFGALAGASGAVVLLSVSPLGLPVLFAALLGLAVYGVWYAARRQGAGVAACVFAAALGFAQWPFTAWRWPRMIGHSLAHAEGSVALVAIIGLAVAPLVISRVQTHSAGASV
jgi:hypothetical protein